MSETIRVVRVTLAGSGSFVDSNLSGAIGEMENAMEEGQDCTYVVHFHEKVTANFGPIYTLTQAIADINTLTQAIADINTLFRDSCQKAASNAKGDEP